MAKREVSHNNGIHVYEGYIAIVEDGQIVHRVTHLVVVDEATRVPLRATPLVIKEGDLLAAVYIGDGKYRYFYNEIAVYETGASLEQLNSADDLNRPRYCGECGVDLHGSLDHAPHCSKYENLESAERENDQRQSDAEVDFFDAHTLIVDDDDRAM